MPTYVYRNLVTNQTFELKQSMKDDALTVHPETGEPVKRLLSAPGIAFKGSGFYANDSRSPSRKASAEGSSESKSESQASPGSEPKGFESKSSDSKGAAASSPAASESSSKSSSSAPSKGGSGE
ncbi:FmdB family zinc ribbon protein [Deinococcus sp.]|uniref:FmdB family zinc ribbon protein n=1 Tax=Deinococcus sp. TaxID=47478 RepID=UPI00344DEC23